EDGESGSNPAGGRVYGGSGLLTTAIVFNEGHGSSIEGERLPSMTVSDVLMDHDGCGASVDIEGSKRSAAGRDHTATGQDRRCVIEAGEPWSVTSGHKLPPKGLQAEERSIRIGGSGLAIIFVG
ncbi:hypothetical protein FOZ62_010465, partial [Perkinsus olseni]